MGFKTIAGPLISRGVPVFPLRPRSKKPVIGFDDWPDLATTDVAQVDAWDKQYPNANCGSVAIAQLGSYWFLEVDRPEAVQRLEAETGQRIPKTFRVRSRPGRGHYYFKQTVQSLAMGNITQAYVKGGDWSARVDRQYVVSPGSVHPDSGLPYEIISKADIVEAPEWLIKWLISQKIEKKAGQKTPFDDGEIITGARNVTLTSIAGRMRQVLKATEEQLYDYLISVNETRCSPPLEESEIRVIAHSVGGYPVKDDTVYIGGKPAGTAFVEAAQAQEPPEPEFVPDASPLIYPKFPLWAIQGTSIYEGLCKPWCEANPSVYPEYLWLSATLIMLNFMGTKVRIGMGGNDKLSLFAVLIGRPGETFKSGSFQAAIEYFKFANVCEEANAGIRAAQGKSLIWTAGSPEGLGLDMQRTQCNNAILFYDELDALVKKASIESSNLRSALLSLYQAAMFQNTIKARKEVYSLGANTYCASLMACCPDKKFTELWGRLGGRDTGLDDRFFFLMQPEFLKECSRIVTVPTFEGSQKTRALIDKAVAKAVYQIDDLVGLNEVHGRQEVRAEKFALGFAVDLDKESITDDCVERAVALVRYEQEVKDYFGSFESSTKEGRIQQDILHKLRANKGTMPVRELQRQMHAMQFGTYLWNNSYQGLIKHGWIQEEGAGTKGSPRIVRLMRSIED